MKRLCDGIVNAHTNNQTLDQMENDKEIVASYFVVYFMVFPELVSARHLLTSHSSQLREIAGTGKR